jgi:cytochrome P450
MPSALQAVGWNRRSLPFMERCRKRYGDVFTLRVTHWGTWVFLCDPEHVKAVLTTKASRLGVDLANPMLGPLLGDRSVFLLEEPEHMERRRLMLPSFHGEAIARDDAMVVDVARREARRWPIGKPFELWPRMQEITQEVIVRAVFGAEESDRLTRLRGLLGRMTVAMNDPRQLRTLALLGPRRVARSRRYRDAVEPVEAALLEEVRSRRAEGDRGRHDVVSMLVHAHYEDGSPMSEKDLRDELMTLLTDGPTSTSLAWAFERLLHNPEKLERLREELDSDGDGPYLNAVVKETLRIVPPVPVIVRRLREPMSLGGYELPAGTTVAPCIASIHLNERFYPDPMSFEPERFIDRQPGTYEWIPFGGGVRRCLAASYAELEMKRVLRTVFEEVELRPVAGRAERMRKSAISFSPDQSGLVIAEPRIGSTADLPTVPSDPQPTPSLPAA